MSTHVESIGAGLARAGLDVVASAVDDGSFAVGTAGRGQGAAVASVLLPSDLLAEYVTEVSGDHLGSPDPRERAMGMVHVLLMEILTKDHGDGRNLVRSVSLRRGRDGRVTFTVDQEPASTAGSHSEDVLGWTAERPPGWNPGRK